MIFFQEMNEKLKVEMRTTAGESAFSNGHVERYNSFAPGFQYNIRRRVL